MINTYYLEMVDKIEHLQVIFIGKDPYPTEKNNTEGNIPFFKESLRDFQKQNCSGKHLFKGLGIELPKNEADWNEEYYINTLVDNGVILLNASYNYISEDNLSIQRSSALMCWQRVNKNIVENSSCKVIVAQSAYKIIGTHLESLVDKDIRVVPHPDYRNSWNKHKFKFDNIDQFSIKSLWEKYYKNKGGLLKIKSFNKI